MKKHLLIALTASFIGFSAADASAMMGGMIQYIRFKAHVQQCLTQAAAGCDCRGPAQIYHGDGPQGPGWYATCSEGRGRILILLDDPLY